MVVDAESNGAMMATKNDSRITPFGKILRLFRIDELPQIISVIKGDMQFIGPRPERKIFVKKLNKITPYYNIRHLIKPGITGWAQVNGRNTVPWPRRFELDVWYVNNISFPLDLKILWLTFLKVIKRDGISSETSATMEAFTGN